MFIVFEGIDGSGKNTQLNRCQEWLENRSIKLSVEAEPTQESEAGKKLAKLLAGDIEKKNTNEILELYLEDRFQHVNKIKKLISQGYLVISSRFDLSSYAYQSIDINDDMQLFSFYEKLYDRHGYGQNCLIPDLTFFFALPNQIALERIRDRSEHHGFEKEQILTKVEYNYDRAIFFLREKDNRKIMIFDAQKSPDEVYSELQTVLEGVLNNS